MAARSNVVPISSSRRATAEKLEGFAETDPEALDLQDAEASPEAAAPAALAAAHSTTEITDDELRRSGVGTSERRRRVVHPAAWAMVGLFGVLVGMSLFLFVSPKEGRVQVVSVMVPAAPTAPPAGSESSDEVATIGPIEIGVSTKTGSSGTSRTKTPDPAGPGTPPPPVNTSLSGLSNLVGGPQVGGPGKAAGSGGAIGRSSSDSVGIRPSTGELPTHRAARAWW
jgi:hypothetical protein